MPCMSNPLLETGPATAGRHVHEADAWVITADAELRLRDRLAELWRYRRIIWFFGSRAVTRLYAKTRLGWPWLLIRPLAPMIVGALVYGRVMQIDTGPYPYFLFLVVATTAWNCFDAP